ncbi:transcriptional regulator [Candidatus Lokiarchaeum ossiferum]|uniref:transcriptional regulator n=1 Tax=Candidatus Lokiarchaeum ossiferum TaxID=2951803 RepID=UPI00352E3337
MKNKPHHKHSIEKNENLDFSTDLLHSKQEEEKKFQIELIDTNNIVKSPYRFNIMMLLFTFGHLKCKIISKQLQITPGNLDHHSKILIKNGWIKEKFIFEIRPLKMLEITEKGKDEFHQFALNLKNVIRSLRLDDD